MALTTYNKQQQQIAQQTPAIGSKTPYTGLNGLSQQTKNNLGNYQQGYKQADTVTQAQQRLQQTMNAKPQGYKSKWSGAMEGILNQINGKQDFKYSFNGDELFKEMADRYTRQGQQAMMDSMGQAAALTGGYGNSYAQAVGQQQYQMYLQDLYKNGMDFRDRAYQEYQDKNADMYDRLEAMGKQEDRDYGAYRDTMSDWEKERAFAAEQAENERNFDYGQYMDQLEYWQGLAEIENKAWNTEQERAEAIRQFNEKFAEDKRRYDQDFAEDVRRNNRDYDRSVLESDRKYDWDKYVSERDFNEAQRINNRDYDRSVLESDRNFGETQRQFDVTQDYKNRQLEEDILRDRRDYDRCVLESYWNYDRSVLESDRKYDWDKYVSERDFNEAQRINDRNYDRSVLESDRDFNESQRLNDRNYERGVFESDRDYNRGVLEADRSYESNESQFVREQALAYAKQLIAAGQTVPAEILQLAGLPTAAAGAANASKKTGTGGNTGETTGGATGGTTGTTDSGKKQMSFLEANQIAFSDKVENDPKFRAELEAKGVTLPPVGGAQETTGTKKTTGSLFDTLTTKNTNKLLNALEANKNKTTSTKTTSTKTTSTKTTTPAKTTTTTKKDEKKKTTTGGGISKNTKAVSLK